ncbi:gamma-glutamylcyclotransferase [Plastorhodobacter daqingensis]|uniref:glutathione-specific gamma-glutamylcyclotransferase n=1 Tax=Plastorhodobacter daqingensis TaxID=1387281 RepID=A0ABW2UMY1_9RHOB
MWVFGYGSLIWNPGFVWVERRLARVEGFRRSFCMRSIHHRGTPEMPGLVLALDPAEGTACEGVAFAVAPAAADVTLSYLRERELISSAYLEQHLPVALDDGRLVEAVTYVVDPGHVQYCGGLGLEEQAQIIARARGGRGPNSEYLRNTTCHLEELGIADAELRWLSQRVNCLLNGHQPEA